MTCGEEALSFSPSSHGSASSCWLKLGFPVIMFTRPNKRLAISQGPQSIRPLNPQPLQPALTSSNCPQLLFSPTCPSPSVFFFFFFLFSFDFLWFSFGFVLFNDVLFLFLFCVVLDFFSIFYFFSLFLFVLFYVWFEFDVILFVFFVLFCFWFFFFWNSFLFSSERS